MKKIAHIQSVKNTLLVLEEVIVRQSLEYRVIESVLIVALNGNLHRTLGDIDVVVDELSVEKVLSDLKSKDYIVEKKIKFGFNWLEAHHPHYLSFTFYMAVCVFYSGKNMKYGIKKYGRYTKRN